MPKPNSNRYVDIAGTGITVIETEGGAFFLIDTADRKVAERHCWSQHEHGYARAGIRIGEKQIKVYLHRLICQTSDQLPHVDHANGAAFDCRSENLRACSRTQNMRNQKRRADNLSGFKGVGVHKQTGKFRARVDHVHLGLFDSAEEASNAVVAVRSKAHLEFARHE